MKAGKFNAQEYIDALYEKAEKKKKQDTEGGPSGDPGEGLIIPDENKKFYDWLKKDFQQGKQEVKVEMSSYDFKPGYSTEGAKDFEPGMYGNAKTSDSEADKTNKEKKKVDMGNSDENIKISINNESFSGKRRPKSKKK